MAQSAIAVLTGKSVKTLLEDGGSGSWLLSTKNARRQRYLVCARNAERQEQGSFEPHGSAFLVGTISNLVPLPAVRGVERWKIAMDTYAITGVPNVWHGWRNPVRYTTLEELGIDPARLEFGSVPKGAGHADVAFSAPQKLIRPLTIPEAKAGLAATLGISPDAIEITIKG